MAVTKTTLRQYEFDSIDDYYEMIITSKLNGQFEQTKDQFKKLSKGQKSEFLNYVRINSPEYLEYFLSIAY